MVHDPPLGNLLRDVRRPWGEVATVRHIKTLFVVNWVWLDLYLFRDWPHRERLRQKRALVRWYLDLLRRPELRATRPYLDAGEIMELYREEWDYEEIGSNERLATAALLRR